MNKPAVNARSGAGLALAAGAFALMLAQGPTVAAQDSPMSMQTLLDRAQIEDLLTRYYYNLGHGSADSFSNFYADDAELVLGPKTYKGKQGIESAYSGAGRQQGANPIASAFSFNVSVSNPLIIVHGAAATAQLIYTEVIIDKQGDPPRVLAQGREYDDLVKQKGHWRIRKRQIVAGTQPPAGWTAK